MRRPQAAPTSGHEPDRTATEEADQAVDVNLILERNMVVHEAGKPGKPGRGSTDVTAPLVMNANEASRRHWMNFARERFDLRQWV